MRTRTVLVTLMLTAAVGSGVLKAKGPSVARPCLGDRNPPGFSTNDVPLVQLAILLDTSNSMDGLIDQARSQLWTIVNEFARARRYGQPAKLQVALYEYGNDRLSTGSGFVRRVLPFTTDLDRVSEGLFALTTNGGSEYCGTVIQSSLDQLAWSASPAALKVIFIAGNEPFTQGPIDVRKVVQRAARQGVTVNTIHCGPRAEGLKTGWAEGARLASGSFTTIDQGRVAEHVEAPEDGEISRLGVELNRTYIPYGRQGHDGQSRQAAQDSNAMAEGPSSTTSRSVAKANHLYSNSGWDLVDAVIDDGLDPGAIKAEDLPSELAKLTADERRAAVLEKKKERQRLQAEINRLNAARQKHVAQARGKKAPAADTLEAVMAETLREQAACKGIELQ